MNPIKMVGQITREVLKRGMEGLSKGTELEVLKLKVA